ncbi:MAG: SufD family Fe-S cluster assembly protein [Acholeplasmatales bacterium]|nr:SufD family Fe-S cluster assembly protein [Acholeplasmatales bacterium]
MSKKIIDISVLGQTDGYFVINKTEDVIYKVNDSAKIKLVNGVNATILDNTNGKEINVVIKDSSYLKYEILDSKDTNRTFDVDGELFINQIVFTNTKENLLINLNSENATSNANVLVLENEGNAEFVQYVDHKTQKTFSNISNVGVAIKKSNITFDTTGKIEKSMSSSNCRQLSRGVVLDDESHIKSKPILLIDEFDCFASHGAAIGKLRDEDLFYLMSRGLNKNDAFLLILEGIIKPFIDNISVEETKESVLNNVKQMIEK